MRKKSKRKKREKCESQIMKMHALLKVEKGRRWWWRALASSAQRLAWHGPLNYCGTGSFFMGKHYLVDVQAMEVVDGVEMRLD